MRISKNHNSLGCEQPLGLDVNQSPDVYTVCTCTHHNTSFVLVFVFQVWFGTGSDLLW